MVIEIKFAMQDACDCSGIHDRVLIVKSYFMDTSVIKAH